MSEHLELIHTEENDPVYNMPYTPAIKVRSGATVCVASVTAAPVYHHHPHIKSNFENIPPFLISTWSATSMPAA
jgi:hypothetical protein